MPAQLEPDSISNCGSLDAAQLLPSRMKLEHLDVALIMLNGRFDCGRPHLRASSYACLTSCLCCIWSVPSQSTKNIALDQSTCTVHSDCARTCCEHSEHADVIECALDNCALRASMPVHKCVETSPKKMVMLIHAHQICLPLTQS